MLLLYSSFLYSSNPNFIGQSTLRVKCLEIALIRANECRHCYSLPLFKSFVELWMSWMDLDCPTRGGRSDWKIKFFAPEFFGRNFLLRSRVNRDPDGPGHIPSTTPNPPYGTRPFFSSPRTKAIPKRLRRMPSWGKKAKTANSTDRQTLMRRGGEKGG